MRNSQYRFGKSTSGSSTRVIIGIIVVILGIFMFFSSVLVPMFTKNVFLMFPFFFGAFIFLVIGMILLTIGRIKRGKSFDMYDATYDMPLTETNSELPKIICPYCGEHNLKGEKFCKSCQSPLE